MSKEMFFVIFKEEDASENIDAYDFLHHYKIRINYQNGASKFGGVLVKKEEKK